MAFGLGLYTGWLWWHERTIERRLDSYQDLISRYAQANGLPAPLVRSIIRAESAGNPLAVSDKGAKGLMQILPEAESDVLTRSREARGDLFDPDYNVRIGTAYLRLLLDRFEGDVYAAVAAYHMGPTRMARLKQARPDLAGRALVESGAGPATLRYCRTVLGRGDIPLVLRPT